MDVWSAAAQCVARGPAGVLVTVIGVGGSAPRHGGARLLWRVDGELIGTIGGGALEHLALQQAPDCLASGQPRRLTVNLTHDVGMCCGGVVELYMEPLTPAPRLLIYGAGHVGAATARLAGQVGFRVTVVDERPEWNAPERLPDAERVVADPELWTTREPADGDTWVLVVTHSHPLDQALIEAWLRRPRRWLGLIGSKAKVARFKARLRAAGFDDARLDALRSPVGLAIGAETAEEIAVSIVAELIQRRRLGDAVSAG